MKSKSRMARKKRTSEGGISYGPKWRGGGVEGGEGDGERKN